MNSFEELFKRDPFPLIVSLPGHGVDWALAAQDNGADAVKVHTSVRHPASGVDFGALEEEAPTFEAMRESLTIPMGIVPGVGVDLERAEIDRMVEIGFDFFDAFISHITPLIMEEKRLAPMLCILPDHTVEEAMATASLPRVVCVEADIVGHDGYGKRASLEDFVRYKILASAISKPLVVPTQRALRPEEVPFLAEMGVGALMIGAIVTNMTVEGVAKATRAFRDAIDSIKH
jgi:hypothetical protein